jgi:hypothetical protein
MAYFISVRRISTTSGPRSGRIQAAREARNVFARRSARRSCNPSNRDIVFRGLLGPFYFWAILGNGLLTEMASPSFTLVRPLVSVGDQRWALP